MYPKNNRDEIVELGDLINTNPSEMAALPNSTNNEDWLVFKIKKAAPDITPLKIGDGSVKSGEFLYTIGWTIDDKGVAPELYKFKVYRMFGNQIFMEPVEFTENPAGLSGAPLINRYGKLVGISSGGDGGLVRACSVFYLFKVLEKYQEEKN